MVARLVSALAVAVLLLAGPAFGQPTPACCDSSKGDCPAKTFTKGRMALIIGTDVYASPGSKAREYGLPDLANAGNDAEAVASLLGSEFGFDVVCLRNPTKDEVIRQAKRLQSAALMADDEDSIRRRDAFIFIYVAGHGARIDGDDRFFLRLPDDTTARNHDEVLAQTGYSIEGLRDQFSNLGKYALIMVIDACRTRIWQNNTGQGGTRSAGYDMPLNTGPRDTRWLTAYAATRGGISHDSWNDDLARTNGLFLSRLLRYLRLPYMPLSVVFDLTALEVKRRDELQKPEYVSSGAGSLMLDVERSPLKNDVAAFAQRLQADSCLPGEKASCIRQPGGFCSLFNLKTSNADANVVRTARLAAGELSFWTGDADTLCADVAPDVPDERLATVPDIGGDQATKALVDMTFRQQIGEYRQYKSAAAKVAAWTDAPRIADAAAMSGGDWSTFRGSILHPDGYARRFPVSRFGVPVDLSADVTLKAAPADAAPDVARIPAGTGATLTVDCVAVGCTPDYAGIIVRNDGLPPVRGWIASSRLVATDAVESTFPVTFEDGTVLPDAASLDRLAELAAPADRPRRVVVNAYFEGDPAGATSTQTLANAVTVSNILKAGGLARESIVVDLKPADALAVVGTVTVGVEAGGPLLSVVEEPSRP